MLYNHENPYVEYNMTRLLETAFEKASSLSQKEQDWLASYIG